jgi:hypothetical protein
MDAILYWNDVALEADRAGAATGTLAGARALAIVHLAMHDTHAAITGGERYLDTPLGVPVAGANVDAAIAAAAHATLAALHPAARAALDRCHAEARIKGSGQRAGHDVGLAAARTVLDDRRGDPGWSDVEYCASTARGAHREDPTVAGQGFDAPFHGADARPFACTRHHELDPPPRPGDPSYQMALEQVRRKGIAAHLAGTVAYGDRRTPEETLVGTFWSYDGAGTTGTASRIHNQVVRRVAAAQGNDLAENARLFALVNMALADAATAVWDQKYRHDLWRPVVGIREDDPSMGPNGLPGNRLGSDCDPFWVPLGVPGSGDPGAGTTPASPSYPSEHAALGAAALQVTRLFYEQGGHGPDTLFHGLDLVSDQLDGVARDERGVVRPRHARSFPGGLWDMILESARSRVYLGVHWVFDAYAVDEDGRADLSQDVGGVPLGLRVAEDVFTAGVRRSPLGSRRDQTLLEASLRPTSLPVPSLR